jgi:GNAT superfamily N-acetyltransferase
VLVVIVNNKLPVQGVTLAGLRQLLPACRHGRDRWEDQNTSWRGEYDLRPDITLAGEIEVHVPEGDTAVVETLKMLAGDDICPYRTKPGELLYMLAEQAGPTFAVVRWSQWINFMDTGDFGKRLRPLKVGCGRGEDLPPEKESIKQGIYPEHQGQRLGAVLLADALQRAFESAGTVGSSMVEVDALDEPAAGFYAAHGFVCLPDPLRLVLPMRLAGGRAAR